MIAWCSGSGFYAKLGLPLIGSYICCDGSEYLWTDEFVLSRFGTFRLFSTRLTVPSLFYLHSSTCIKLPRKNAKFWGVFLSKLHFFSLWLASAIFSCSGEVSRENWENLWESGFGVLFDSLVLSFYSLLFALWFSWSPCAMDMCLLVIERGLTSGCCFIAFFRCIMLALYIWLLFSTTSFTLIVSTLDAFDSLAALCFILGSEKDIPVPSRCTAWSS